ncbi:flagellar biosynthesis anti-sigma factor FlgM [Gilliamella sp. Pra-s65]|uniref:flagellar biosynthesis anti-sigma factor FlgM n=1 Tax=unclassified Gilliamella TaxID=2685620 RepID=UPI001320A1DB|nr:MULTISPECIES: flagellar biosynthesis anti-sigma factor FlgM [unclassified Gilliamella]MWN31927.1 flagellar biosynthesis anti-sigma factor FlgM [Gilliamella sp. Pra-s60]MWN90098.1 flagellar biosynthesis anti-sigma factor FlgM [Gilliamella sp. Pra-s65]MWP29151.1 flagellar biosynthesis anti-sigma factor FlgM [Gilliamella sp. Pra-s54]MWP73219.1 flagellar biosynthesis anti-sigma factor FlgM [Gilliamella sp. Pra-s52]
MSIDATKSVTTISGLLKNDVVNEQQKNETASVQAKNCVNVSTNVSITQHSMDLLHSTDKDIDVEKIEQIKQAITNGSWVIDTHKIADKLIEQLLKNI